MKKHIRVAAIIIKDGSILLVLHRKEKREYYLLPGGGIEEGENERAGLKREVKEEAGLYAEMVRFVFETESVSPDRSRCIVQRVYLCNASGTLQPSQDERVARAVYIPMRDFAGITFYPNIKKEIIEAWKNDFQVEPQKFQVAWED
jgi:ADP-ribose pyrophosphatase YjhB (NUDIX family)